MIEVQQQLLDLYAKYEGYDFISHYNEIIRSNTNHKYSKGYGFFAGLYEPSYVREMQVSNCTIGREVKKIENGYDYKYYFDENGRIILSELYTEQGEVYRINFYFYFGNACEFIHYDVLLSTIEVLSVSYYDDLGRIVRHIETGGYCPSEWEEQLFRYENDLTYITTHRLVNFANIPKQLKLPKEWLTPRTETQSMMIKENILYHLTSDGKVKNFYPIRFKIVDGKKVSVPLPKRVPVFKIIKESMIEILSKWKEIDMSVLWILCESADLVMQYSTLKEDCEAKWNIAFYDTEEEEIFHNKDHVRVLEELLFNNGCDTDDLINSSDYFTNKMIKIIKELRKEGHIAENTAVVLSDLEISEKTLNILKKINRPEIIKGFGK